MCGAAMRQFGRLNLIARRTSSAANLVKPGWVRSIISRQQQHLGGSVSVEEGVGPDFALESLPHRVRATARHVAWGCHVQPRVTSLQSRVSTPDSRHGERFRNEGSLVPGSWRLNPRKPIRMCEAERSERARNNSTVEEAAVRK